MMSSPRRSAGPIRQLSLQQPGPRRQKIRRQRSAEDEKAFQGYSNSVAKGKIAIGTKTLGDKPKVRVAWGEKGRKDEKQMDQVEVVARQILGKSRPATGRSFRGSFSGSEKASILYSRQELAERLRLAWKHRQENKTNIDIVLARATLEERCDSALSSCATPTGPSTPRSKKHVPESTIPEVPGDHPTVSCEENPSGSVNLKNSSKKTLKVTLRKGREKFGDDPERNFLNAVKVIDVHQNSNNEMENFVEAFEEKGNDKVAVNSGIIEDNLSTKSSMNQVMTASQKRASFRSGTNRAFLGPVKCLDRDNGFTNDKTLSQQTMLDDKTPGTVKSSLRIILENTNDSSNDKTNLLKKTWQTECTTAVEKSNLQDSQEKSTPIGTGMITGVKNSTDAKLTVQKKFLQKVANFSCLPERTILPASNSENKNNESKNKNLLAKVQFDTKVEKSRYESDTKDNYQYDKIMVTRCTSELKWHAFGRNTNSKKTQEIEKFDLKSRRTSSAPPLRSSGSVATNNRLHVNIVIDTPNAAVFTEKIPAGNVECQAEIDQVDVQVEKNDSSLSSKILSNRPARSAPLKKRSKSTKRRLSSSSCKNDEDAKSRNRSGTRAKNGIDPKTIDVVTMVSLVSSADSDSEAENSPSEDKLINELRSKLPTMPIIKTSINAASNAIRKPVKSVSFQRDSFEEDATREQETAVKEEKRTSQARPAIVNCRGNRGGLPPSDDTVSWRTETTGLALPVLTMMHDSEETLLEAPLTDREKRCLAVPIGTELRDKKRKLLRTRSASLRPTLERQGTSMEVKQESSPSNLREDVPLYQIRSTVENLSSKDDQKPAAEAKGTEQEARVVPLEPHFQTTKEKECWHLYRKMCDKGVYVSFDTVLRGMLTPTEYRLRQKELLQDL